MPNPLFARIIPLLGCGLLVLLSGQRLPARDIAQIADPSGSALGAARSRCPPAWVVSASPNPGDPSSFGDLAALSATDIWAVGTDGGSPTATLVEHWDGTTWRVVSSPNVASNALSGLAAVAADDLWTVGFSTVPTGGTQTLTLHGDGATWTVVPSPNPSVDAHSNDLRKVAAVAANDVWAVGEYAVVVGGAGVTRTLVEHWDGHSWSVVPSPNMGAYNNRLAAVAAIAANDVWAVGDYESTGPVPHPTLILHWDGVAWTTIPSPNPGTDHVLRGVAGVAANDVWAVGSYSDPGVSATQPLLLHWDGRRWRAVPGPAPGSVGTYLYAVAAAAPRNVWAVGYALTSSAVGTVTLHWEGTAWRQVVSPSSGLVDDLLAGVAILAADEVWAVGT